MQKFYRSQSKALATIAKNCHSPMMYIVRLNLTSSPAKSCLVANTSFFGKPFSIFPSTYCTKIFAFSAPNCWESASNNSISETTYLLFYNKCNCLVTLKQNPAFIKLGLLFQKLTAKLHPFKLGHIIILCVPHFFLYSLWLMMVNGIPKPKPNTPKLASAIPP